MLSYNRIAYEIDGVKNPPDDVDGLSMLQHFDYPETWSYNGNASIAHEGVKFGKGCVYFPDTTSSVSVTNSTGMFNINTLGNYELEAFVKVQEIDFEAQGYKFYEGHTFKYYGTALTWKNAKTACENLGGHLATSTSADKNTFLTTLTTARTWLGGTDEETEGTWKWITGETWSYTNWEDTQPDNSNSGEHYLETNYYSTGVWNDGSGTRGYICEWDYDFREHDRNILSLSGTTTTEDALALAVASSGELHLSCSTLGVDGTASALSTDTWHHLLLRISGEYITLFVDGAQVLRQYLTEGTLSTEAVTLGGYVGYMDEFAFRRNAGSGVPEVPTIAYDTETITETVTVGAGNAPVSRAAWSCANLPEGLTLSSAGVLSGHPTTAGTYECNVSVATNWGTNTKTIRIVIE